METRPDTQTFASLLTSETPAGDTQTTVETAEPEFAEVDTQTSREQTISESPKSDTQMAPPSSHWESPTSDTQTPSRRRNPELPKSDTQTVSRRQAVLALLAQRHQRFARGGCVVPTYRTAGGQRRGPYFELQFRESGRLQKTYLGRDEALAAEVRAELARLQSPPRAARAERRRRDAEWRQHMSVLCQLKAAWSFELAKLGLHLHGSEVRGWREATNDATSQS